MGGPEPVKTSLRLTRTTIAYGPAICPDESISEKLALSVGNPTFCQIVGR